MREKLPATVLSGCLGAGKTTRPPPILHNAEDRRIAVIVNDTAEVNIDASLVEEQSDLVQTEESLVDSHTFPSTDLPSDRGQETGPDDERTRVDLLVDQVARPARRSGGRAVAGGTGARPASGRLLVGGASRASMAGRFTAAGAHPRPLG
jgi:hypothetical protein